MFCLTTQLASKMIEYYPQAMEQMRWCAPSRTQRSNTEAMSCYTSAGWRL